MSTDDAAIGFASPGPTDWMPYSVSMPHTLGMATDGPYPGAPADGAVPAALDLTGDRVAAASPPRTGPHPRPRLCRPPSSGRGPYPAADRLLAVLAGPHAFDGTSTGRLLALGQQGANVDDALALLARDLGPVVGVRGVGQVLVLLVLLPDRVEHVVGANALALLGDGPLDGQLLGTTDDVLDHGAGGEVLEVEDLLVPVLVSDLEEAVEPVALVHGRHRGLDHAPHRLLAVP